MQRWDEADRHLEQAAEDPADPAATLILRALVATGRADWPEAERRWQRVIDEFPGSQDAYGNRATAIRMQGRVLESVDAYRVAMDRAPMDLGPPSMLAHMLETLPPERVAALTTPIGAALDRHLGDVRQTPLVYWSKARVALADGRLLDAVLALRTAQAAAINDQTIASELAAAEARLAAAPVQNRSGPGADGGSPAA